MRPLLTIFALLIVAAFLAAGCTPQTEADAGTVDSSTSSQMNKVGEPSMKPAGETDDDDGAEVDDDDDKGEVEGAEGDDVDKPGEKEDDDDKAETKTTAIQKPEMKLVAYRNAEGQLACPVMGSPIASEKAAFSYADYKGKRYYFCCDGCPKVFEKNKDTYAK